jgi:phage replication-related protein YjqB (UPF0714/DUF867 family)
VDTYADFAELEKNETKGIDYDILFRQADSKIAIMALHGGGIEPGTFDIADAIAGNDHTFYAFKGLKKTENTTLHISSNRYDEPIGLRISREANLVVSIHGCHHQQEIVFIGGMNREIKHKIMNALRMSGFMAIIDEVPGHRGISADNICNRCQCGEGVQLEISKGLREKMFENIDRRSLRKRTKNFFQFVHAVKEVLAQLEKKPNSSTDRGCEFV